MMGAWHKALKNIDRTLLAEVSIECSRGGWGRGLRGRTIAEANKCWKQHFECDFAEAATKQDGARNAKKDGWTYDKDGNWLCPVCSKGGA
jgi:hypothetical protein